MGESVSAGVRSSFQLRRYFVAFCFVTGIAMTLVFTRARQSRVPAWEAAQQLDSTGFAGRGSSGIRINTEHAGDQFTATTDGREHDGKVSTSQRDHSGSSQSQVSSDGSSPDGGGSSGSSIGTASASAGSAAADIASGESQRRSSKATPASSGHGSLTHPSNKRQQSDNITDSDVMPQPDATERHTRGEHDHNEGDSQPKAKIKDGSIEPPGESSTNADGSHTENPHRSHDHSQHPTDGSSGSQTDEGHGESDAAGSSSSATSSNRSVGGRSSRRQGGGKRSPRGARRGRRRAGNGQKRTSRGPIQLALLQAIEAAADANGAVMLAVSALWPTMTAAPAVIVHLLLEPHARGPSSVVNHAAMHFSPASLLEQQ